MAHSDTATNAAAHSRGAMSGNPRAALASVQAK